MHAFSGLFYLACVEEKLLGIWDLNFALPLDHSLCGSYRLYINNHNNLGAGTWSLRKHPSVEFLVLYLHKNPQVVMPSLRLHIYIT